MVTKVGVVTPSGIAAVWSVVTSTMEPLISLSLSLSHVCTINREWDFATAAPVIVAVLSYRTVNEN